VTHVFRPAFRRSLTAAAFATLLAITPLTPAFAQAAPGAPAPVAASGSSATTSVTASSLLASTTLASSNRSRAATGRAAASRALSQVGSRYQWGATGPNAYDCSGLTRAAWSAAGVTIPRTSRAQSNATQSVSRSNLRPGDLVFFGSPVGHVEMYVGNGRLVGGSVSRGAVSTSQIRNRSNIVGYGRP
jgi:peptidoglycan DL-endopeptidase CwlO